MADILRNDDIRMYTEILFLSSRRVSRDRENSIDIITQSNAPSHDIYIMQATIATPLISLAKEPISDRANQKRTFAGDARTARARITSFTNSRMNTTYFKRWRYSPDTLILIIKGVVYRAFRDFRDDYEFDSYAIHFHSFML